jgi:hypothetical protein
MTARTIKTITWVNLAWAISFSFVWIWLRHPVERAWGLSITALIEAACRLGPTLAVAVIVVPWSFKRLDEIEERRDV